MQQRILVNTPCTLSVEVDVDGSATDPSPDSATVTITRADGTPVVTGASATNSGTGTFSYSLSAAQNTAVDFLTATWTTGLGVFVTTTEVVGDFLFTIADARRVKPLDKTDTYTAQAIIDARTLAETALEEACCVAFAPRYFTEKVDGDGGCDILLSRVRPLSLTSCIVDGTAIDVSTLELYPDGRIYNPDGWSTGRRNVVVTGTHGYAIPPPRVSRAAILLAKRWLVDTPQSDRATSMTNNDGTIQYMVAGLRGAVFDIPEANLIVEEYGVRPGFLVA